jgi:uncharacterized protein YtpQ (UPF0354 family)
MSASQQKEYCLKAIAYLKVVAPDGDSEVVALSHEDSPILKDIGHGLLVGYLVDEGQHYSYVQQKHLEAAGISESELHSSAVNNLRAVAEQKLEVKTYGSMYIALMGGDFEASLILVPDFWSAWYGHLSQNGFVAAFPARDLLAFGDIENPNVVPELRAMCERVNNSETDHPLTNQLFTNVNGLWQPYG